MTRSRACLSSLAILLASGVAFARPVDEVKIQRAHTRLAERRAELGLDQRHSFAPIRSFQDERGGAHARFTQFFQGVRVMGGESIVHEDAQGRVLPDTDALVRNVRVNTTPAIDGREALAIAHAELAPKGPYAYDPTCELVVYPVEVQKVRRGRERKLNLNAEDVYYEADEFKLAYHIHTILENDVDELAYTDYLVDAHTGAILKKWSTLLTADARGNGSGFYNGPVTLFTNSVAGGFELRDMTRGTGGNYVTNMNKGTAGNGAIFTDTDNAWGDGRTYVQTNTTTSANGQTVAVDTAFGQQATWDMLKNMFGRDGMDGNGKAIFTRVHYGKASADAFFSTACYCVSLGDASSTLGDATSIQTVAHEMGHAFNYGSANLTYAAGETGGLNESNSDIAAAAAYFFVKRMNATGNALPSSAPQNDACWNLFSEEGPALRYMTKPSKDGSSPNAWSSSLNTVEQHSSSGPNNRMFFFLTSGASNVSSSDYYSSYTPNGFTGIGPDKAYRIWYRAITTYLTASSKYAAARTACISAAKDLYGAGSVEEAAVWNAYAAINVGAAWSGGTGGGDTTLPTTTATETGTSGTITLSATANDNIGVTKVEFYVDGALKGTDTTSPYSMTLDSTTLADGSHTLVTKAYDAAGNVGTSTSVNFNIQNAVTPPPAGELVANGGFESGATSWTGSTAVIGTFTAIPAFEGVKNALFGGKGVTTTQDLYQTVTIPADVVSATMGFKLRVTTSETTTASQYDKLTVQVRNTAGTAIATLGTFSNLNKNAAYETKNFDLTPYKGQTVQLYFKATEDSSLQTSFAMDAITVTTGGTPAPDITAPAATATVTGTKGVITLGANATDNVGVTKVEFLVDGVLKGTDTTSPFTLALDSTTIADGAHRLVVKAYDAAGNVGTSTTLNFAIDNSVPASQDLILNGGFESGATSWTGTVASIGTFTGQVAYEGTKYAWLCGNGTTTTEAIYQDVAIPAGVTSATLSFYLHIDTAETTTATAYDKLTVTVKNTAGTTLGTLATYSNLNKVTGFTQKTFNLSAYKGQTVRIHFNGTEDSSLQTSFVLDKVALVTQ